MSLGAAWQTELAPDTEAHLSDLLGLGTAIPSSARPMTITATPPAPKPPGSAERLADANQGKTGLIPVQVEERLYPLWIRAGTTDAAAATAALAPPLKIPFQPRRILEIGAGSGYRSVALAQAYPQAEILTAEPDPAHQRVAMLNTLPYRNINTTFALLGTDNARYAFTGRTGEAGHPTLARDDTGPLTAQPLKTFLHTRGWNVFDTVILTPNAACLPLLRAPWPASVRLIAVENGGVPLPSAIAEHFPEAKFLTTISGNYVLLHRRDTDPTVPPYPIPVFNPEGPPQSLTLANIAAKPPGFFPIGTNGFRLHPNASDAPPASLKLSETCRNFAELHLSLRVALPMSRPIRFTAEITTEDGAKILSASATLQGGETRNVIFPIARHEGPCEVAFSTEMAESGAANTGAWAEFLSATFV